MIQVGFLFVLFCALFCFNFLCIHFISYRGITCVCMLVISTAEVQYRMFVFKIICYCHLKMEGGLGGGGSIQHVYI